MISTQYTVLLNQKLFKFYKYKETQNNKTGNYKGLNKINTTIQ